MQINDEIHFILFSIILQDVRRFLQHLHSKSMLLSRISDSQNRIYWPCISCYDRGDVINTYHPFKTVGCTYLV